MNKSYTFLIEKCVRFVQIQLFVSLISLPLLGLWGLPVSVASVIGNIFFTPWVALFILLSTVVFFTHLIGIPNSAVITLLEYVTQMWYYCLKWGKKSWVMGISYPLIPSTFILAVIAILVICHRKWGQLLESTVALGIMYSVFLGGWYLNSLQPCYVTLSHNTSTLSLVVINKQVLLYDNNYLKKMARNESWVEYTFLPWCLKNTGTITIDKIFITHFDSKVMEVLSELILQARVLKIYLPYFSNNLSSSEWRAFFQLKKRAQQEGTIIERLSPVNRYKEHNNCYISKPEIQDFCKKKLKNVTFS